MLSLGSVKVNFMKINPLYVVALKDEVSSEFINEFYVSTESEEIIKICKNYEVNFIKRPKRLSKKNTEKQETEVIVH